MTGALKDAAVASAGGVAAKLTESQLSEHSAKALINAKYSQKQELEADDGGYDFLVSKEQNPHGMARAFQKLQELEGGTSPEHHTEDVQLAPRNCQAHKARNRTRSRKDGSYVTE